MKKLISRSKVLSFFLFDVCVCSKILFNDVCSITCLMSVMKFQTFIKNYRNDVEGKGLVNDDVNPR